MGVPTSVHLQARRQAQSFQKINADSAQADGETHHRPHFASKLLRGGTKAASGPRELKYCSATAPPSGVTSRCCHCWAANWGCMQSIGTGSAVCGGGGGNATSCCACC